MLKPLGDRVFIKPDPFVSLRKSGLIVPITVKDDKPHLGKVMETGKDAKESSSGDRVIYNHFAATEWSVGKEKYVTLPEADVLVRIEG